MRTVLIPKPPKDRPRTGRSVHHKPLLWMVHGSGILSHCHTSLHYRLLKNGACRLLRRVQPRNSAHTGLVEPARMDRCSSFHLLINKPMLFGNSKNWSESSRSGKQVYIGLLYGKVMVHERSSSHHVVAIHFQTVIAVFKTLATMGSCSSFRLQIDLLSLTMPRTIVSSALTFRLHTRNLTRTAFRISQSLAQATHPTKNPPK